MSKWSAQHYNALAADIRNVATKHVEAFPRETGDNDEFNNIARLAGLATLQELAKILSLRFEADNDLFEPSKFLDSCNVNGVVT